MSIDLAVLLADRVTFVQLDDALRPFGARLNGHADRAHDEPHDRVPIALQLGAETLETSVALRRDESKLAHVASVPKSLRSALAAATLRYQLSSGGRESEYTALWVLAAALTSIHGGVVDDPQAGAYRSAAWTRKHASALLARVGGVAGDSAEARFVARLERDGFGRNRIVAELEAWRAARFQKAMDKEFGALLDAPDALARHLGARPPLSEAELTFLLARTWEPRRPDAARTLVASAVPTVLCEHLRASVGAVGFSAELYLAFLADAGAFTRLDDDARAQIAHAASSSELPAIVAAAR